MLRAAAIRRQNEYKPYKCDTCDARYTTRNNLVYHKLTHTGEKPYKCEYCKRNFRSASNLRAHFRVHTGEKPFKCDACDERFAKKSKLRAHLRVHPNAHTALEDDATDESEHASVCNGEQYATDGGTEITDDGYVKPSDFLEINMDEDVCEVDLKEGEEELELEDAIKPEPDEDFEYCDISNLMQSEIIVNENEEYVVNEDVKATPVAGPSRKSHSCNVCNARMDSMAELRLHQKTHDLEHKPCECAVCGARFHTIRQLNGHKQVHSSSRKVYACTKCNAHFNNQKNLNYHVATHTYGILCEQCDRRFRNKAELAKHLSEHHSGSHRCAYCNATFNSISTLVIHCNIYHLRKSYDCSICQVTFMDKNLLLQHNKEAHEYCLMPNGKYDRVVHDSNDKEDNAVKVINLFYDGDEGKSKQMEISDLKESSNSDDESYDSVIITNNEESNWTDFHESGNQFPFSRQAVQIDSTAKSPADVYFQFVDDRLLELIVEEVNAHLSVKSENCTTVDEMKNFIGILLYTDLLRLKQIEHYWSERMVYRNCNLSNVIPWERFILLMQFWEIADNNVNSMVKNVIEQFCRTSASLLNPPEMLLIHRQIFDSMNVFFLGDKDGYTYSILVWEGQTVPQFVLSQLCKDYFNLGHTVVTDPALGSVSLALDFLTKKTHTLSAFSKRLAPSCLVNCRLNEGETAAKINNDGVILYKWREQTDVYMLSTQSLLDYKPCGTTMKPSVVVEYNKQRRGIDLFRRYTKYKVPVDVPVHRRLVVNLLLGVAVANACVLYRNVCHCTVDEFRELLVEKLLTFQEIDSPSLMACSTDYRRESILARALISSPRRRNFELATPEKPDAHNIFTAHDDEEADLTNADVNDVCFIDLGNNEFQPLDSDKFKSRAANGHLLEKNISKDKRNRVLRGRCTLCYEKFRTKGFDSKTAGAKTPKVQTYCNACSAFLCGKCFDEKHKSILES